MMKAKMMVTTAALALALGATGINAQTRPDDAGRSAQNQNRDMRYQKQDTQARERDKAGPAQKQTTGQSQSPTTGKASDTDQANEKNTTPPRGNQPAAQSTPAQDNQPKAAQGRNDSAPAPRTNQAQEPRSKSPTTGQDTAEPSSTQRAPSTGANEATSPSARQPSDREAGTTQTRSAERLSASLQTEQRTRLNQAITKLDAKPVTNVNFSISVGTTVPTSVTLRPVPAAIVAVIPQYRGYDFFVVRNEVVIVEPRTHRIVDVIERRSPCQARTTTTTQRRVTLSQTQREYIRRHATSRRTTTATTGAAPRSQTRVIVGEEVPDTVVIESFPEEVYREVPAIRSYRYIHSDRGVYLVEPDSRRVIEEID